MFVVNQNKTRKSWHIVHVRVLFLSTRNKIYWGKILGITLLTQKIALPFYVMLILHLVIWQLMANCSVFDRNIQLFEILSNSDFMWFSVRHWWVSVILHWISVKHWLLPWQFAVLSMSVVMFDRTVCVFDRISFRFDRTAQKC